MTGRPRPVPPITTSRPLARYRDTLLAAITDTWATWHARKGRGQVVGIVGEPGVGKSRLIWELLRSDHLRGWVVLRAGQAATEQDLRAYCRERLAAYKVPARVEFRDSLPKTMVGKVLRRALKESIK